MKTKELREKSNNELNTFIKENKENLKKLRFSLSSRQLKNYEKISQTKKDIARAKTIITERIGENK